MKPLTALGLLWLMLLVPARSVDAGEEEATKPERAWKAHNVAWTLPSSEWAFHDVTTEQQGYGYFTKVVKEGVGLDIYAGSKSSSGLNLTHLSLEMLEEARSEFGRISAFNQGVGSLAGLQGIYVWVKGSIGNEDAHVSYHCILVKGVFYFFYARCWNGNEETYGEEVQAVRQGLRFLKPPKGRSKPKQRSDPARAPTPDVPVTKPKGQSGVVGPIAALVEPASEPRGAHADEALQVRRMGVIFEKPAGISTIEPTGYQVCLLETRADPSSYFYFDAVSEPKRERTKDDLMTFVAERAKQWMQAAGGTASIGTPKNDRPRVRKCKWCKGKGISWEFTGEYEGVPFTERGWVVIFKQRIFVIRAQFGGTDAVKTYKKLHRSIEKAWAFE